MPSDLSVSAVAPPVPVTGRSPQSAQPPHPHPGAERTLPNPSLRLEPELGLVVIEFRNDSGTIEASYPSERQLAAYRAHALDNGGALEGAAATATTSPRSAPNPSSGSTAWSADKASSR